MRRALIALLLLALALPAGAGAKRQPVAPAHEGGHANAPELTAKGLCAGRLLPSTTPTPNSWGESFPVTVGPW
jgi:hypothetical protein